MKAEVRMMIRRTALPAALAVPLAMVVPGTPAAHANFEPVPRPDLTLVVGQIATLEGVVVQVGDTIAHLPSGPRGCDASAEPVGLVFAPGLDGMSITLDIDAVCDVVVSAVSNTGADVVDEALGLLTLSPGTGLPPLPETVGDAPDSSYLTTLDATYPQGVITCKHQGWAKATILMRQPWGWQTGAETRNQSTWTSTGNGGCYGRSVSNMIVNTNSKYSYCYTSSWDYSNNLGCWYRVKKGAPDETWSDVYGKWLINSNNLMLHAYDYTDTSVQTPFIAYCTVSDGSLPRDTRLDCHGRQDY